MQEKENIFIEKIKNTEEFIVTEFVYHDMYRGNDQMLIKATWITTLQL